MRAHPFIKLPPDYRLAPVAVALAALLSLNACNSPSRPASTNARAFTDEIGRTVAVNPEPQRIVSLAPSVTETLFALGLADRLVGVTSFCDYPPEATAKAKVGDTQRPSIERIVALKPDLVIASTASQLEQFVRSLDELQVPIYVSNPQNIEGVLSSVEKLGEVTGATESARDLTARLRARIDAVESRIAGSRKPDVFFMLGDEPLITVGGRSFINDLIARAGGQSISADERVDYPQYSLETVIARKPEVIFLQAGNAHLPDRLSRTPAAKSGRVFHIDDDLLLRPGPRIVDGLEQMAAMIHPEASEASNGQPNSNR